MVPVFDISLIGTLTAIWGVLKVVLSSVGKGLDWIAKKALSALVGSKFWATAFFLGLAAIVITAFYSILSACSDALFDALAPDLSFDQNTFILLSYIVRLSSLSSFLSFLLSLLLSFLAITKISFLFRAFRFLYTTLSSGWKI